MRASRFTICSRFSTPGHAVHAPAILTYPVLLMPGAALRRSRTIVSCLHLIPTGACDPEAPAARTSRLHVADPAGVNWLCMFTLGNLLRQNCSWVVCGEFRKSMHTVVTIRMDTFPGAC